MLCSHFLLSYNNQAMTKSVHWRSLSYDLYGNLGGVFPQENTPKVTQRPTKAIIPYKQVIGRNDDHERLRMTNAFILCDLV